MGALINNFQFPISNFVRRFVNKTQIRCVVNCKCRCRINQKTQRFKSSAYSECRGVLPSQWPSLLSLPLHLRSVEMLFMFFAKNRFFVCEVFNTSHLPNWKQKPKMEQNSMMCYFSHLSLKWRTLPYPLRMFLFLGQIVISKNKS